MSYLREIKTFRENNYGDFVQKRQIKARKDDESGKCRCQVIIKKVSLHAEETKQDQRVGKPIRESKGKKRRSEIKK